MKSLNLYKHNFVDGENLLSTSTCSFVGTANYNTERDAFSEWDGLILAPNPQESSCRSHPMAKCDWRREIIGTANNFQKEIRCGAV